jgi:flagellar motor switch protein FliN
MSKKAKKDIAALTDEPMPVAALTETADVEGLAGKAGSADPVRDRVNLDLVMDVELNVTLRFGQRLLTLREVLDLTSGSVIELDRQVEEPIELLLEGKVIARGEAVVIDGNYGLRVTDVPQPISRETLL